jgi:hypothetical protein
MTFLTGLPIRLSILKKSRKKYFWIMDGAKIISHKRKEVNLVLSVASK